MTDDHPLDVVRDDRSKAVRVDYPSGDTEFMWFIDRRGHTLLVGVMNGRGPMPLEPGDARTVVDKYDSSVVDASDVTRRTRGPGS